MVTVEPADSTYLDTAGPFLQTGWWARFKGLHGWSALGFRVGWVHDGVESTFSLSVLLRKLPLGLTLAYVPHGPGDQNFLAQPDFEDSLEALSLALRSQLPRSTVCLRWDLLSGSRVSGRPTDEDEGSDSPEPFPLPLSAPFRKPPADVQPPDTVIVALADDETLLGRMHKKTRYNIKLAEKKGVTVQKAGVEALAAWYTLYKETAGRDKISIHSEKYYRDLFGLAPDLSLWLAWFDGKLLAGNIVLVHGKEAVYLYGASSNEHRNLMAPYALQWAALRDARDQGAVEYDMFGIPPTNDPTHPMHGLYRFKTGFGGDRVHRHGAWDRVFRPLGWLLWTRADALRIWYYKVWKKR